MSSATIKSIMTTDPVALAADAPLLDAAQAMRDHDIGDVIVLRDDKVCGLVTDRDIVVRALAVGLDVRSTKLDDICSHQLVSVSPDDSIDDAVKIMRDNALRRLPVLDKGKPVGIVSIGDLAREQDPESALAEISAAPPNV